MTMSFKEWRKSLMRLTNHLFSNTMNKPKIRKWSPTGKPVVPNKHTHLRAWALKRFGAQAPRLWWVIRRLAKSAEAQ
jgi:hypothetical protein